MQSDIAISYMCDLSQPFNILLLILHNAEGGLKLQQKCAELKRIDNNGRKGSRESEAEGLNSRRVAIIKDKQPVLLQQQTQLLYSTGSRPVIAHHEGDLPDLLQLQLHVTYPVALLPGPRQSQQRLLLLPPATQGLSRTPQLLLLSHHLPLQQFDPLSQVRYLPAVSLAVKRRCLACPLSRFPVQFDQLLLEQLVLYCETPVHHLILFSLRGRGTSHFQLQLVKVGILQLAYSLALSQLFLYLLTGQLLTQQCLSEALNLLQIGCTTLHLFILFQVSSWLSRTFSTFKKLLVSLNSLWCCYSAFALYLSRPALYLSLFFFAADLSPTFLRRKKQLPRRLFPSQAFAPFLGGGSPWQELQEVRVRVQPALGMRTRQVSLHRQIEAIEPNQMKQKNLSQLNTPQPTPPPKLKNGCFSEDKPKAARPDEVPIDPVFSGTCPQEIDEDIQTIAKGLSQTDLRKSIATRTRSLLTGLMQQELEEDLRPVELDLPRLYEPVVQHTVKEVRADPPSEWAVLEDGGYASDCFQLQLQ